MRFVNHDGSAFITYGNVRGACYGLPDLNTAIARAGNPVGGIVEIDFHILDYLTREPQ